MHYVQHGVKEVDITVFNQGVPTDLGVFTFNQAPGTDPFNPQNVVFAGQPVADSVLLTIKSNWLGDTYGSGAVLVNKDFDAVGLNEVQFLAVGAPEPAAGATLLAGPLLLLKRKPRAETRRTASSLDLRGDGATHSSNESTVRALSVYRPKRLTRALYHCSGGPSRVIARGGRRLALFSRFACEPLRTT